MGSPQAAAYAFKDNEIKVKEESLESIKIKEEPIDFNELDYLERLEEERRNVNYISVKETPIKEEKVDEESETEDEQLSFTTDIGNLGLITPIKKEEEDDESGHKVKASYKSVRCNMYTLRSSPYSTRDRPNSSIKLKNEKTESPIQELHRTQTSSVNYRLKETDPEVLARRQKQIDFGKNTIGYDNYLKLVPRQNRSKEDPKTPDKFGKYSRRGFDGLVKQWRLKLHKYDPE